MANYDLKPFDGKAVGAREWLGKEYRALRTGRASPAILDGVHVSAYGSMTPLKQVANVGVEDARTLRVSAYDAGLLKDIERAISAADLGVGTSSDGTSVRVTFPELSAERREQLVKLAKAKLEEARGGGGGRGGRGGGGGGGPRATKHGKRSKRAKKKGRSPRTTNSRLKRSCKKKWTRRTRNWRRRSRIRRKKCPAS